MKTPIFFWITLALALSIVACQSDPSPKTGEELQKIKTELEARKKELADKQQIAEIEKELSDVEKQIKTVDKNGNPITTASSGAAAPAQNTAAPAAADGGAKGTITGSGVTMRKDATVQSEKLGAFNQNETVTILNTRNVNNEGEAILTKPIALFTSESGSGTEALKLPKGKAVLIENYDSDKNKYNVSYQDNKQGKLYAQIEADAVETITYSTWYQVRRANGTTGWVLGKFLKQ